MIEPDAICPLFFPNVMHLSPLTELNSLVYLEICLKLHQINSLLYKKAFLFSGLAYVFPQFPPKLNRLV